MRSGDHLYYPEEENVNAKKTPPKTIGGTPVQPNGEPLKTHGGSWLTLIPVDGNDGRIWEFDELTGRVVCTCSER